MHARRRTPASSLLMLLLFMATATLTDAMRCREPPPVLELSLYRGQYVSVIYGGAFQEATLRVRFDVDDVALYVAPSGGTYDPVDASDTIVLANAVCMRLPVRYVSRGDVSDPVPTSLRVAHQGVLGLGPGSPIWRYYDSWTLKRSHLALGSGDATPAALARYALPAGVRANPAQDYTFVRDLAIYLRWSESTLSDDSDDDGVAEARAFVGASSASDDPLLAAFELHQERAFSFSLNNDSSLTRTVVLRAAGGSAIELDAYLVDSATGRPIELVRRTDASSARLELGRVHLSDSVIASDAAQALVVVLPSASGPTRPNVHDYVWLVIACALLWLLHVPGLSDRVYRARWLFMPTNPEALVTEDWTALHLITRIALICALWVVHGTLASYRATQDFFAHGWWAAYWGCAAYVILVATFASYASASRESVARYANALMACAWLLLVSDYEDSINRILLGLASFATFIIASDLALHKLFYPDHHHPDNNTNNTDEESAPVVSRGWSIATRVAAVCEMVFFGWLFSFYTLAHIVDAYWINHPSTIYIQINACVAAWTLLPYHAIVHEAASKQTAIARFIDKGVYEAAKEEQERTAPAPSGSAPLPHASSMAHSMAALATLGTFAHDGAQEVPYQASYGGGGGFVDADGL